MRLTIKILTVIIILLPLSEIFLVSYSSFVDLSNEWRTVTIKANNHSYYPSVNFDYNLTKIEFYFKPNKSWYYKEPPRNGWSKLRGFSKGLHHDGGSARLVYKCVNDTTLLAGSYCYVNGVHPNNGTNQQAILDTIYPDQIYHCIIKHEAGKFKFYFEDTYWEVNAGECPNWGYMLNPFIGGVFTLDHNWTIDLLDITDTIVEPLHAMQF